MNIKEKFNNLFKYPAFYLLSISGWIGIIFYLQLFYIYIKKMYGTGIALAIIFGLHSILFLFLLLATPVVHLFCKDKDSIIENPKILNNKLIKTLTTIGALGSISFLGLIIFTIYQFFIK